MSIKYPNQELNRDYKESNSQGVTQSQGTTTGNSAISVSPLNLLRAAGSNPMLRAAASLLLQRSQFGDKAGFQSYDGKRDLYEALGYKKELTITDYRSRYERGGIAETVVECLPKATWKGKLSIFETESPEVETQFEEDVESLFERLSIQSIITRADILAGLGRYSIILLGTTLREGETFADPLNLNTFTGPDDLLYLTPIPEDRAEVELLVGELGDPKDLSNPRFGLPELYKIKLGTPRNNFNDSSVSTYASFQSVSVHWTRVIHIAEGLLENDIYGKPRLRACWNLLDDMYKLVGGGSEAAWNRMQPPTLFDLDPELDIDEGELLKFKEEIEDVTHRLRPYATTRGVTPKTLSSDRVTTFKENVETVIDLISAVMRIPKRRLLGTERGQLASGQDDDNFNDTVAERRETFAEPVVKQLVNRLIDYGLVAPLRPTSEGDWSIIWAEEEELNELEKGNLIGKIAEANNNQVKAEGKLILTSEEIRDQIYGLEPLPEKTDDEIERDQKLRGIKPVQEVESKDKGKNKLNDKVPVNIPGTDIENIEN